jgi:hypothetical protein
MYFCQSCGASVNESTAFCPKCGQPIQHTSFLPKPAYRGKRAAILVGAVVLILVLSVVAIAASAHTVNVTGFDVNIVYAGSISGYLGPSSQALGGSISVSFGKTFTHTLTLTSGAFLPTHSITSIALSTAGLTLVSISPSLPYNLTPSSSVCITLTIQAPNSNFDGPLEILVYTG